ncbi:hypothetical protein MTQ13_00380 [Streptomyces sp. XM4011]|uniref:hypothetical protein n=1 Tax=Streptomyces sp. XM4011 TaxID=2929780 RepID=UPI001FFB1638|nr:hypothetical protein [Streptomyces sp. XM4011]MCK1812747.1 hypothetical protein [Streptomyces sp. XM4011]
MRLRTSAERARVRHRIAVLGLLVALQTVFVARQAHAATRTGWCDSIPFADKVCEVVSTVHNVYDFASDPFGYLTELLQEAVVFLFSTMMNALLSTTRIDWSDPGFLRTYGMAFAVSSVLTVVLWLIAVAKRVVQGTPALQAVTESIGFLLLSVLVSALAPAAIAQVTQLFDEAAEAMFAPVAEDTGDLVVTVTAALATLAVIPGGPIILSFLALALLAAVAGVWMTLIIRDALILSGLVFGVTVFSGLVDRSLWSHVKRWVGVMGAIIASKYVVLTTVALATGMLASGGGNDTSVGQAFATVFTAIALLWLALYLPFQLAKFLPLLGDDIQGMHQAREDFAGRAQKLGGHAGDTFQELSGRFGRDNATASEQGADAGGEPGNSMASGTGSGTGAGEAAASSTGVGAAVVAGMQTVDMAKEHVQQTAERSVESAGPESVGGQNTAGPEPSPDSPVPSAPAPERAADAADTPPGSSPDTTVPPGHSTPAAGPWDEPPETAPPPGRRPEEDPAPTTEPETEPHPSGR